MTISPQIPLLPAWLQAAWLVVLGGAVAYFLCHAVSVRGRLGWWHLGHAFMASGMVAMYLLPTHEVLSRYWGIAWLFAVTTAAAAGASLLFGPGGLSTYLWATSSVDLFAMTYMALPSQERPTIATYLIAAFLCLEAFVWLGSVAVGTTPARAAAAPADSSRSETSGPSGVTPASLRLADSKPAALFHALAHAASGAEILLAILAVSMTYMLIAMQTMSMTDIS